MPRGSKVTGTTAARTTAIDGLRAVACLFIMTAHTMRSVYVDNHSFQWRLLDRVGTLAIVTFFMLSGFFLYRPIASAHLSGRREPSTAKFYRRRLARVLPAYWVALTAALWLFKSNHPHGTGQVLMYFSLTEAYKDGYALRGLFVAWTLVVEMGFYLTLPIIALLLCRLTPASFDRRQRLYTQLGMLVVLAAVGMGFRWVILGNPASSWRIDWSIAWADIFAFGMLLAVVMAWVQTGGIMPKVVEMLARARWLCWGGVAAMLWYLADLKLDATATYGPTRNVTMLAFAAFGIAGTLLIMPFALEPSEESIVMRVLGSPGGAYMGMIAYGVYLWHGVFLPHIDERAADGRLSAAFWPRLLLLVGASGLAGAISWHLIEKPIAEALARWETRRAKRPPTTVIAPEASA